MGSIALHTVWRTLHFMLSSRTCAFFFKQWCNTVIKLITLSVEVLLSHYSSSCMLMLFLSGELGACLLN